MRKCVEKINKVSRVSCCERGIGKKCQRALRVLLCSSCEIEWRVANRVEYRDERCISEFETYEIESLKETVIATSSETVK